MGKKKKTITIDYDAAIKNAKSDEAKGKALSVINDYKFSGQTVKNWKVKAPDQVAFLSDLAEALEVPISDFIKKI